MRVCVAGAKAAGALWFAASRVWQAGSVCAGSGWAAGTHLALQWQAARGMQQLQKMLHGRSLRGGVQPPAGGGLAWHVGRSSSVDAGLAIGVRPRRSDDVIPAPFPPPPPLLPDRSMLASNTDRRRPPGDADYCARMRGRSPKETR